MATLATNSHLSDDDRTKVEERKDALEAEVKRRGATRLTSPTRSHCKRCGWRTAAEHTCNPAPCSALP